MAPMSEKTKAALDRLNKQIEAAESFLLRMPSSRMEECCVNVNFEMSKFDSINYYLQVYGHLSEQDEETEMLSVVQFDDGDFVSATPLLKLKVSQRAQVAAKIPELIALAVQADANLGTQVDDAAAAIEHAIASQESSVKKSKV